MKAFLPEQSHFSQVHLRTANLDRALMFYSEALGLNVLDGPGAKASLAASAGKPELILLSEDRNALPRSSGTTGLYHVALRYSSREGLARAFARVARTGWSVAGASDHGVSEAIYLSDPDGSGVELYADRPREQWRWRDGQVAMTTRALNLEDLLATCSDQTAMAVTPPLIEIGHIHLQVADLAAAERFYGEFLGFSVTQRSYPGALFFAAGRYHHHIAVNVWAGQAAPSSGSVGLVSYRLEVPCAEILYCLSHRAPLLGYDARSASGGDGTTILQIRDPNGAWLELQPSPAASAPWQDARSGSGLRSSGGSKVYERSCSLKAALPGNAGSARMRPDLRTHGT